MTKTLILMRHTKSSWENPGLDDLDRPLNRRGRHAAQALGAWLKAKGWRPDQVQCSAAARTRETLAGLGIDAPAEITADLYHATANQMLRVLSRAVGDRVLMLGHNPGIASFAADLVDEAPLHPRFVDYPTGATLVVRFGIDDWSRVGWRGGEVLDFVVPRELDGE